MPTDPNAQKIIDACKANWEAYKSDCSGFAKAVATALEITTLTGQANEIYAELLGKQWTPLKDGVEAKAKADAGMFVLAALTGAQHDPPQTHGHVAVVVTGPLAHDKYPTGYWARSAVSVRKTQRSTILGILPQGTSSVTRARRCQRHQRLRQSLIHPKTIGGQQICAMLHVGHWRCDTTC